MIKQAKLILIFICYYCFKREGTVSSPEDGIWISRIFLKSTYLLTISPGSSMHSILLESKNLLSKKEERKDYNSSKVFKNQTSILAAWSQLTFHFLKKTCPDLLAKESNTCLEQTFPKLTHFCWELGNTWNHHLLFICLGVSFCLSLPLHTMKAPCSL